MGFATIAAQTILFIFLLVAVGQLFVYMKVSSVEDNNLLATKEEILQKNLRTDISILNATYDSDLQKVELLIENSGKETLDPALLDIYVDEVRIPRSEDNRSFAFSVSYTNPLFFDPEEHIIYTLSQLDLSTGDYAIRVVTENGVSDLHLLDV